MTVAVAALTSAWIAGALTLGLLALPVASVTRLLPARQARIGALLWAFTAAAGLVVSTAVFVSAPLWAAQPLLYTPHLERPLTHLCLAGAACSWLGIELIRAVSLAALGLTVAGLVRLALGLQRTRAVSASLRDLPSLPSACHPQVFVADDARGVSTTVGLLSPRVVVSRALAEELPADARAAVICHEQCHSSWRDPLARLVLSAVALAWPLPGLLVLREWARMSEVAADWQAVTRVGAEAWRGALAALDRDGGAAEERLHRVEHSAGGRAGWMAAAASWGFLGAAALALYGRAALLSVVCLFETVLSSWQ